MNATPPPAEIRYRLGRVSAQKGRPERAIAEYQVALQMDERFAPALYGMGEALLDLGRATEALEWYARAQALAPIGGTIDYRFRLVQRQLEDGLTPSSLDAQRRETQLVDQPDGKIDLTGQKRFDCHRSGWGCALAALEPLHHRDGTRFDGFLENNFAWLHWREGIRPPEVLDQLRFEQMFDRLATSEEQGIVPYTRPWVGVLHNPPDMPPWYRPADAPQTIFAKDVWKRSAEHCRGLFVLSESMAEWVRHETGLPVSALLHPTEAPEVQFTFERFADNPTKKIVQIGWWLRNLNAIYRLPIPRDNPLGYEKVRLVPHAFPWAEQYQQQLLAEQAARDGISAERRFLDNTRELPHVSDSAYDRLLSENIVLIQLYAAAANNTVIECMARATPLLVNPLPAVVEYLGPDYPFYYEDPAQTADKAMDPDLIERTHRYLRDCATRPKLTAAYFRESFQQSAVYRGL